MRFHGRLLLAHLALLLLTIAGAWAVVGGGVASLVLLCLPRWTSWGSQALTPTHQMTMTLASVTMTSMTTVVTAVEPVATSSVWAQ